MLTTSPGFGWRWLVNTKHHTRIAAVPWVEHKHKWSNIQTLRTNSSYKKIIQLVFIVGWNTCVGDTLVQEFPLIVQISWSKYLSDCFDIGCEQTNTISTQYVLVFVNGGANSKPSKQ